GNGDFYLRYTESIYYPTYNRLDGLLVGVVLACIKTFRPLWWEKMMSCGYLLLISGLLTCGCAIWLFRDRFVFSATLIGFPLLSLGLGFVVAASISPQVLAWLQRVLPGRRGERIRSLSAQCFALMATLAYSLYLTHKEIAHLCRVHLGRYIQSGSWSAVAIALIASICVATLLYLAVERPFLRLRERLSSRRPAPSAESAVASQIVWPRHCSWGRSSARIPNPGIPISRSPDHQITRFPCPFYKRCPQRDNIPLTGSQLFHPESATLLTKS